MGKYTNEEKLNFFKDEINFIKNPENKDFAKEIICTTQDYFFDVEASSSGKYHPNYAVGEHGLLLHTRAAMNFLKYMTEIEQCTFTDDEKDLLMIAILAHDTMKRGDNPNGHTLAEHPLLAADRIRAYKGKYLTPDKLDYIADAIESHMGQWNQDYKGNTILPKPVTEAQKIVHLADYLASRKAVEFVFDSESGPVKERKSKSKSSVSKQKESRTKDDYANLYVSGKSFKEIAEHFGVKTLTAENNVLEAAVNRTDISLDNFIESGHESLVLKALDDIGDSWDGRLRTIKEKLPEEVTYCSIKATLLKHNIKKPEKKDV